MTPRWVREHRRRRRVTPTQRQHLVRLARSRVVGGWILNPGKVGEPSNGALLLRLAALIK